MFISEILLACYSLSRLIVTHYLLNYNFCNTEAELKKKKKSNINTN